MTGECSSTPQGQERRREILVQAIDVFGEAGFGGARIDEVARRVGIRRPSILYHFPDKQALYEAAVSNIVDDILARVLEIDPELPGRLEAIANAWIDFIIARPNAARVLLRQMIDANPITIQGIAKPVETLLASIQLAMDDQLGAEVGETIDATEFILILSSTSLVWVSSRSAVEGAFGLDTLSPQSVQRHRRTLHALTRQLLSATSDGAVPWASEAERALTKRKRTKHTNPREPKR
jgi:TetR/AcrR family transcriptional regulator